MKTQSILLLISLAILPKIVSAQTGDGGDKVTTTVISVFQPEITRNIKKIVETPSIRDSAMPAASINYNLPARKFGTSYFVEPIKSAKMTGEPLIPLNHLYLKGGLGNYLSLYGEAWYNSVRSKDLAYGVHVRHFSSSSGVDAPGFSGFSDDDVNLFGKKFIGKHTVDGGLDYSRNAVYFYGDDVGNFAHSKDSIHQFFNFVSANVGLLSHYTDSSKINHEVRLKYYYMDDHYKTSENNILLSGTLSRYIHEEMIGLDGSVDYYSDHSLHDTTNQTILHLHPFIAAEGEKWEVRAGLSAFAEFGKGSPFYSFMPDAEASYDIYKHIITPYVGFEDGEFRNSYKRLTDENPFVNPNVVASIENTRFKYTVLGGLRGNLGTNTSYDAHASYGIVENAAFFVNDTLDPLRNKFKVEYHDGSLFKVHGELAYQKSDKLHFLAQGDFVKYFLDDQIQQWHTPTTRFTLSARYNLKSKVILKADLFALNEQFAETFSRSTSAPYAMEVKSKELKPLIDVNLGFEYRYTKYLSGFLTFNNMGAVKYYRWNDYPTQRFNLMAGVTCIF
jgi:hypothetical protein